MSKYWDKRLRDKEIVKLWKEGKTSQVKLAMMFNVSGRTIQRVLREADSYGRIG